MADTPDRPAYARIWQGRTPRDRADAYEAYHRANGIPPLLGKALAVQVLRQDRDEVTDFSTVSWWESLDAMRGFVGDDLTTPHHLPRDAEFLIELPKEVRVLRLLDIHGRLG